MKQKEKKEAQHRAMTNKFGSREKAACFFQQWQSQNAYGIADYNFSKAESDLGKANACNAKARAIRLHALPAWADLEAIEKVYVEAARKNMHVDHVIPLRGKVVCGLHVEENLKLLTAEENLKKGNRLIESS